MSAFEWTPEKLDELRRLSSEGFSARQAGEKLGVSRNAILGKCWRIGLHMNGKAVRGDYSTPNPSRKPFKRVGYSRLGPVGIPMDKRITALAVHYAGFSFRKTSERLGVSVGSLQKWAQNPAVFIPAKKLGYQVRAEREAVAKARAEAEARALEMRLQELSVINAPALDRLPFRHRQMMELRLSGLSLKDVGAHFGITRERVRQIEIRARSLGLRFLDDKPLTEAMERYAFKARQQPAPRQPLPDFHEDGRKVRSDAGTKRRAYRLSDAERERRRAQGHKLAEMRWGSPT
jgi:DNA-directed RNA polymerase specialized sigma24 family protein